MQTSQECTNLFKAMIATSAEIGNVAKTKQAYGYKYAPFDSIVDMLRLTLPKHQLWFSQDVSTTEGGQYVLETLIMHESGEWMKSRMVMTATEIGGKSNATQQLGASITYFKRYILSALFGIATDEDVDGNVEAVQRKQEIKANVKAAKAETLTKDQVEKAETLTKDQVEKAETLTKDQVEKAFNFIRTDYEIRILGGETEKRIVNDYAALLGHDFEMQTLSDKDTVELGRKLYTRNTKK